MYIQKTNWNFLAMYCRNFFIEQIFKSANWMHLTSPVSFLRKYFVPTMHHFDKLSAHIMIR